MQVIHVPPPSKEAFNKSRPMSDLIKSQVKHFKHVEEKLSPQERLSIPQHRISSENDAALYIAAMTRLLRRDVSETVAQKAIRPRTITLKPLKKKVQLEGLSIAASAAAEGGKRKRKSRPKKSVK